jgi:hypothetical protein
MRGMTDDTRLTPNTRGLTLVLLVILGGAAAALSARALVDLSRYPSQQAAGLRRQADGRASVARRAECRS